MRKFDGKKDSQSDKVPNDLNFAPLFLYFFILILWFEANTHVFITKDVSKNSVLCKYGAIKPLVLIIKADLKSQLFPLVKRSHCDLFFLLFFVFPALTNSQIYKSKTYLPMNFMIVDKKKRGVVSSGGSWHLFDEASWRRQFNIQQYFFFVFLEYEVDHLH